MIDVHPARGGAYVTEQDTRSPLTSLALLMSLAAIVAARSGEKPFQLPRAVAATTPDGKEGGGGRRLWEDPLEAVVANRRLQRSRSTEWHALELSELPDGDDVRRLFVTVPDEWTHDAREFRMRTRGAVQAAMTVHRYRPRDPESMPHAALAPFADPKRSKLEVPFEIFDREKGAAGPATAVVVWVEERAWSAPNSPPGTELLANLQRAVPGSSTLIGPTGTFALMQLPDAVVPEWTVLSPWATRYQPGKLPAGAEPTIRPDTDVAKVLVGELRQRGIGVTNDRQVLLVVERDSDFARAWVDHLAANWGGDGGEPRFQVAMFSRGLDGLLGSVATDGAKVEIPEGRPTLDYLRRLKGRSDDGQPIVAVGVFCQDIHDKLLVLQALRPALPEALFFTNDLDAWYGHPETVAYTRNLVVASAYGLAPDVPGHLIAPFRDSYQTSVFVAVGRALAVPEQSTRGTPASGDFRGKATPADSAGHPELPPPQVFEIGSGGAWLLHATHQAPTGEVVLALFGVLLALAACTWLAVRDVGLGRTVASLAAMKRVRKYLVAAATLPLVAWGVCKVFPGGDWHAEPFSLFEGISAWPTELLRLLAFWLSLIYGAALLAKLGIDFNGMWDRYGLHVGRAGSLGDDACRRLERRAAQSLLWAVAFFAVGFAAMAALGLPHRPVRGDFARAFDMTLVLCSVLAMLWLMFLVATTAVATAQTIRGLRDAGLQWRLRPGEATALVEPADLGVFTRLRLLQDVASLGGRGIYGPFVVLLVMILGRWGGFDDWTWPLALVLVMVVSGLIAVVTNLLLTRAARAARDDAVVDIDRVLFVGVEPPREKQLQRMRADLLALNQGVFAGIGNHPTVRALLIPTGGLGGLSLVQLLS